MRFRTKVTALVAGAIATAGIAAVAPLASAAVNDTAGEHCVLLADNGKVACSDSEAQSTERLGAQGYVRGAKIWNYKNYSGSGSLTFLVPRACSAGYDNEGWRFNWPSLSSWNNKASSVKTFNRCDIKLFDNENFGGADSTWIDARADLSNVGGGWNNRASSIRLS
ncbi:MAG: hypothetical protein ACRDUA_01155 [Micromonosporaceae bacterium]